MVAGGALAAGFSAALPPPGAPQALSAPKTLAPVAPTNARENMIRRDTARVAETVMRVLLSGPLPAPLPAPLQCLVGQRESQTRIEPGLPRAPSYGPGGRRANAQQAVPPRTIKVAALSGSV